MEEYNSDSVSNLTMLATKSFDHILDQVRSSCLNFTMQISPFSAVISLKKTLVKDQSGNPSLPAKPKCSSSEHIEDLVKKNHELEKKLIILTNKNAKLTTDCSEAYNTIKQLQKDHQEALKARDIASEASAKIN